MTLDTIFVTSFLQVPNMKLQRLSFFELRNGDSNVVDNQRCVDKCDSLALAIALGLEEKHLKTKVS